MRLRTGVVLMATTALLGCGEKRSGESLRIGALISTSGDLGGVGTAQLEGVRLAIDEINAAGGVLDQELELVHRDDGTDESRAGAAAAELADSGVSLVIGPAGSGLAVAGFSSLKGRSIVQIATSATSPTLSTLEDDGYLFRTCASDASRGVLVARRARAKGFSRVAVLHMPGVYGEGLATAFEKAFIEQGGTVTGKAQYVEGQSSYSQVLADVFATHPEAVLLVAYPVDGARIIDGYNRGYSDRNTFWFLSDGLADAGFVTVVGASGFNFAHEGVAEGTTSGPDAEAFLAAFQARYSAAPQPGDYAANAYDAVYIAALSMVAGQSEAGPSIRDNLTVVSSGGTSFGATQFKEAVAALERGEDIDYVGASGKLDFDEFGDAPGPQSIWKVIGGQLTTVEQGVEP